MASKRQSLSSSFSVYLLCLFTTTERQLWGQLLTSGRPIVWSSFSLEARLQHGSAAQPPRQSDAHRIRQSLRCCTTEPLRLKWSRDSIHRRMKQRAHVKAPRRRAGAPRPRCHGHRNTPEPAQSHSPRL